MNKFLMEIPTKIEFGAGALNELTKYIASIGKKACIVTDKNSYPGKDALLKRIQIILVNQNIQSCIFNNVEENPTDINCDEGASFILENSCDFVIALGGGSAIDAGKMMALVCVNEGNTIDYMVGGKYMGVKDQNLKCLPIIVIATTAGTGSEATPYSVIVDSKTRQKPGMVRHFWYPVVSIVDPELIVSLPLDGTIDTGLDAFFHAYEDYVSRNANVFTDMFAIRAMELVIENLQKCIEHPSDLKARGAVFIASTFAGISNAGTGTIIIHSMGHAISGRVRAIHGKSMCAVAVAATKFIQYGEVPEKFAKIAILLGADPNHNIMTLAGQCDKYLKAFLVKFNRDISLSSLGVTESMIPTLVEDVYTATGSGILNTSIDMEKSDIERMFKGSM